MKEKQHSVQLEALYIDALMETDHRNQTGSFYTPYDMARWIVWKAIQHRLSNSAWDSTGIGLPSIDLWKRLVTFKVADIASGTGVFLIAWLDYIVQLGTQLCREGGLSHEAYSEGLALAASGILAVDIHGEALQAFEKLVEERHGLSGVRTWCTNALKDDFLLDPQIKAVLDEGGFDLILGNPPYIGEKSNRSVFNEIKETELYQRFYVAKMDYWYFFLHRSQSLLKPEGVLAYLVSSYFVTADGAVGLRRELQKMTIHTLVDFTDNSLFKAAKGHHSMAVFLSPQTSEKDVEIIGVSKSKGMKTQDFYEALYGADETHASVIRNIKPQKLLYLENGYMSLMAEQEDGVYKRLVNRCQWTLGELCQINQGIVSGLDSSRLDGKGVFVFDEVTDAVNEIEGYMEVAKPFYKNSDIDAYWTTSDTTKKMLYIDGLEADFEDRYPQIIDYLLPHRPVLEQRRECQNGRRPWYALQWPRKRSVFEGPKLVVPHRASRNRFAFTDRPFYGSADIYYISVQKSVLNHVMKTDRTDQCGETLDESQLLAYLMAVLNSRVYNFLLIKSGKKKGDVLELYATPLKKLPVYLPASAEIVKIADMGKNALELRRKNDWSRFEKVVDDIESAICELYRITPEDRIIVENVVKIWRKENVTTTHGDR